MATPGHLAAADLPMGAGIHLGTATLAGGTPAPDLALIGLLALGVATAVRDSAAAQR